MCFLHAVSARRLAWNILPPGPPGPECIDRINRGIANMFCVLCALEGRGHRAPESRRRGEGEGEGGWSVFFALGAHEQTGAATCPAPGLEFRLRFGREVLGQHR